MQFLDEWLVPTVEPLLPADALAALRQETAPGAGVAVGDPGAAEADRPTSRCSPPSRRASASRSPTRHGSTPGSSRPFPSSSPAGSTSFPWARPTPTSRSRPPIRSTSTPRRCWPSPPAGRCGCCSPRPSRIRAKLDELYRGGEEIVSRLLAGIGDEMEVKELTEEDDGFRAASAEEASQRPDHPAGGHDARRWRREPRERHPRRADRGRGGGALPHRRRAAPGDEDSAQRRASPHLPHQDHVGARHRRPAPAAGRPRAGLGERRSRWTSASPRCPPPWARRSSSGS